MPRMSPPLFLLGLVTLSCVPPMPFQPYSERGLTSSSLIQEEVRILPIQPSVAFRRITEALLNMSCRITTSDSSNDILSFEQIKEFKYGFPGQISGSAIKEGTLHMIPDGSTVRIHLVLGGRLLNYPGLPKDQRYSRLSPEEHKSFLNDLAAELKI